MSPGRPSTTALACVPLPPKLNLNLTAWPVLSSYSSANCAVSCCSTSSRVSACALGKETDSEGQGDRHEDRQTNGQTDVEHIHALDVCILYAYCSRLHVRHADVQM